jgi:hypothetical protein
MMHDEMATVPPQTPTPAPNPFAVLPEIEEDVIVTVPPKTIIPPPLLAMFPLMVHDEMATVPSPT